VRTARLLAAILLLVAAYETALALDWVSIGAVPGVDAPGAKTAVAIGGAAMVGGAFLLALAPTRLALLLPLGSVAVVLARYYTFDQIGRAHV